MATWLGLPMAVSLWATPTDGRDGSQDRSRPLTNPAPIANGGLDAVELAAWNCGPGTLMKGPG